MVEVVEAPIEVELLFGARILLGKTEPLCDSIVVVQVIVQVSIEVHVKPVLHGGHGYISDLIGRLYVWIAPYIEILLTFCYKM